MDSFIKYTLMLIVFIILCYSGFIIDQYISIKSNISSPVEEMYHRQLVITLDSILDARFGAGCCEEVIDSDNVSIPQRLFSSHKFVDIAE